jgi:addiction module HigA family antidote
MIFGFHPGIVWRNYHETGWDNTAFESMTNGGFASGGRAAMR